MIWLPRVETGKTGKKSLSTYDITSQLSITVNRLYIVKVGLELYIYIYVYVFIDSLDFSTEFQLKIFLYKNLEGEL